MNGRKGKLLIVEDESELRTSLAEVCEVLTSDIVTASNGREALQIIRNQKIETILSDLKMPEMDGLQLLAEVRLLSIEIPFILLTAHGDRKSIQEALRIGANDFLEKPFCVKNLLDTVEGCLNLGTAIRDVSNEVSDSSDSLILDPMTGST